MLGFRRGELEAEILRKPLLVTLNLLVEPLDSYPVKSGKVGVKDHGLAAEPNNGLLGFTSDVSLDGAHVTTILQGYKKSIDKDNYILEKIALVHRCPSGCPCVAIIWEASERGQAIRRHQPSRRAGRGDAGIRRQGLVPESGGEGGPSAVLPGEEPSVRGW